MPPAAPSSRIEARTAYTVLADPIDILAAEHAILRAACASLEVIAASSRPQPEIASDVAATLRAILPRHTADEEDLLFPLLRARAEPDDEIECVLARLAQEHAEGGARTQGVLALLDRMGRGRSAASPAERDAIGAFADAKLRHLSLETAIVLPIARERLSPADRARLHAGMRDRNPIDAVAS